MRVCVYRMQEQRVVGERLLFYKLAASQPPDGRWVTHVG